MSTSPITGFGLTSEEAQQGLRQFGYNELPEVVRRSTFSVAVGVLQEPMILLLLASAFIYLVLGDAAEAVLLIFSALIVIAINIVQDIRSERALEALKSLTSPRALVVRDGETVRVATREIVPGDVLIITEGDRVAADARLLEGRNVLLDESLLSGESLPVEKHATDASARDLPSGSLVVRGTGLAEVTATGAHTEIGKIGAALNTVVENKTMLEQQTRAFVRIAATISVIFCIVTILLFRLTRGGWIEASLAGLSLAMSLLPEEFPVILSVFLALGARRLSSSGILIRRLPAVEALGTVTTLCVDKTGTLTRNEMTVVEIESSSGVQAVTLNAALTSEMIHLLSVSALASHREGFDPMDRATHHAAEKAGLQLPDALPVQEIPIAPELPVLSNIWAAEGGFQVTSKGAPEAILTLCKLASGDADRIMRSVQEFAKRGLRVLAVAEGRTTRSDMPLEQIPFTYQGLLAYADPLREGIRDAVAECYRAGIRVIMITGDYSVTARAIAMQAGLLGADEVLSGKEIGMLNAVELAERVEHVNVYARVTPSQKLELVELLKERGAIVAMTGDGVNDAPALKAAHIGVAMGGRGTDVAREASSVVLTGDDFPSLVSAVRLGRRTYDNIKKAMYYVIAMHFPVAGLAVLPLLTGLPIIFYPIHIVLIELLLDPISSIMFEAEPAESNVMERPPRDPAAPIFQSKNILFASMQGIGVFLICSLVYLYSYDRTHSELESRTLTFATLLFANLSLAVVNRSWSQVFLRTLRVRNNYVWWCVGLGLAILFLITEVGPVSRMFHFGPFHAVDWLICAGAAAISVTWFELFKLFSRKRLIV